MAGIASLQVFSTTADNTDDSTTATTTTTNNTKGDTVQCLVFSDHDPGTLERAQENYEATEAYLQENGSSSSNNRNSSGQRRRTHLSKEEDIVWFEPLRWGDRDAVLQILERTRQKGWDSGESSEEISTIAITGGDDCLPTAEELGFDLVLGSDLVYCKDVVKPLFTSAALLMSKTSAAVFLMTQSFAYEDETEEEIDRMCKKLSLKREILRDDLGKDCHNNLAGVRVQKYTYATSSYQHLT